MNSSKYLRRLEDEHLQLSGVLEGACPVQASGQVGKYPFYFHARWDEWAFSVAETQEMDAVDMQPFVDGGAYGFLLTGPTKGAYDAGWMPLEEAERIIRSCCSLYQELRNK